LASDCITYHFLNAAAVAGGALHGELLRELHLGNASHVHVGHVCLNQWRHGHLSHIDEPAGHLTDGLRPLLAVQFRLHGECPLDDRGPLQAADNEGVWLGPIYGHDLAAAHRKVIEQ